MTWVDDLVPSQPDPLRHEVSEMESRLFWLDARIRSVGWSDPRVDCSECEWVDAPRRLCDRFTVNVMVGKSCADHTTTQPHGTDRAPDSERSEDV